jgi:hypothetical protein
MFGFSFLLITSFVNWDSVIAKYNYAHADTAFLHLDYMRTLSDKALPDLQIDYKTLKSIEIQQNTRYSFKSGSSYITHEEYLQSIKDRITTFQKRWDKQSWLSWNYAEYRAYNKLISK